MMFFGACAACAAAAAGRASAQPASAASNAAAARVTRMVEVACSGKEEVYTVPVYRSMSHVYRCHASLGWNSHFFHAASTAFGYCGLPRLPL